MRGDIDTLVSMSQSRIDVSSARSDLVSISVFICWLIYCTHKLLQGVHRLGLCIYTVIIKIKQWLKDKMNSSYFNLTQCSEQLGHVSPPRPLSLVC